jgi:hypothetical protein
LGAIKIRRFRHFYFYWEFDCFFGVFFRILDLFGIFLKNGNHGGFLGKLF